MPMLYIIDGYAQFFRNYHAIRTPMSSPVTKEPTNMTFGFIGMLLKLLRGQGNLGGKPDYLAVALDVSGDRGTFRSELYPEYKATRSEPPVDLKPQVERCLALLEEIGVPVIGMEGFEADDVMATLVKNLRVKHPDLTIRLISKDKDLKQLLVEGAVELFDVHHDAAITATSFEAETGLKPSQVIDMLTLMGDTVDNVPGVEGVGEKTAIALVKEHGSVAGVIAAAGEIKGKRGEKIREWIPKSELTRQLITLRADVPVEMKLDSASVANLKLDKLIPRLKELGFNRYQDDVRVLTGINTAADERAINAVGFMPTPEAKVAKVQASVKSSKADSASHDDGFGTLFAAPAAETPKVAGGAEYQCVRTAVELASIVEELQAAPAVAFDTETTGLSPLRTQLCGVSVAATPERAAYVPVRSPREDEHLSEAAVLDAMRPILADPDKPKCGHNLKFDMLVLRHAGVKVELGERSFDSMIASYILDASRSSHGLDALSLALLGRGKHFSISELIGSGKNQRTFDMVPLADATPYAAADAELALLLQASMAPQLRELGLWDLFTKVEMPLVETLAEMEYNGIVVDADELERQRRRLQARITEILDALDAEARKSIQRTFEPDSPKQLSAALFNSKDDASPGLGLKPIKRTKTGYSTDAEVLEELAEAEGASPIPKLVLEYRQLSKLVSTYLVSLREEINPRTGRVHTSFSQTVAATGRLASSDPNLQNIPIRTDVGREIRKAFIAPPGRVLITADYSQIELRLLAHLSQDPALIEAFKRDEDIHAQVAAQIHNVPIEQVTKEHRNGAKMVNFGIVYGITPFGLARRLGVSNAVAEEIIRGYKLRFSGISTFLEECIAQAKRHGYVETILKRRRPIPDIESNVPSHRAFAERTAINSVVQGSAADLIKLAMITLHRDLRQSPKRERGKAPQMLLQIHDELVFECDEGEAEAFMKHAVDRMENAMSLVVPLKVDARAGKNWYEGK